jgi:K+ transporter
MQNGILLIGLSSMATLIYTKGHIEILVVMYSINVFLTFSLSELGMIRFWIKHRKSEKTWLRDLSIHATGFILCASILCVMVAEKLREGAWLTLVITCCCIALCFLIKRHYNNVRSKVLQIDKVFRNLPVPQGPTKVLEFDDTKPTAVILVSSYSGLGIHIYLNIFRLFPNAFKNVVFMSVAVVDSDFFKDSNQLHLLSEKNQSMLKRYVDFSHSMGIPARYEHQIGTDVVESVSQFCVQVSRKYSNTVFFAGELIFEKTQWYHRILHNETAYAILRRIRFSGLPMVMIPAKISEDLVKINLNTESNKLESNRPGSN